MEELIQVINIGKVLKEQLNQIEVVTFEDLQKIGSKEAWLKIKAMDPSA